MRMRPSANPEQLSAIQYEAKPLVVVAGAGSGKTFVLTQRIRHMVENRTVTAKEVLAITFTNKAAREMKERLSDLFTRGNSPFIGTFHAFCAALLREHISVLGRSASFQILNKTEQYQILRGLLKHAGIDNQWIGTLAGYISQIKQSTRPSQTMDVLSMPWRRETTGDLATLYNQYNRRLVEESALDFDDLLRLAYQLLSEHDSIRKDYEARYPFILVDEFQDSNDIQVALLLCLTQGHRNITVVGDDDQTIYSWRGADPQHMLGFKRHFPDLKTIYLTQNYRCSQRILSAANHLIQHNPRLAEKSLWTENAQGEPVDVHILANETEEATHLVQKIQDLTSGPKGKYKYKDIGILYRVNAQSRAIEDALLAAKIPYKLVGSNRYYERTEIKDILAYFQLVDSENHSMAFARAIQAPKRRIGKTSIERCVAEAQSQQRPLADCIQDVDISPAQKVTITEFFTWIRSLKTAYDTHQSLGQLLDQILKDTEFFAYLEQQYKGEAPEKIDSIKELRSLCIEFSGSLPELLDTLALKSDEDQPDEQDNEVTMMTMHHAKGLEFPLVFIAGVEDGLFPYYRTQSDRAGQEEERRLAYVAITRAKEHLFLLGVTQRLLFGKTQYPSLSSVIAELPKKEIRCLLSPELISTQSRILLQLNAEGIRYESLGIPAAPLPSSTGSSQSAPIIGEMLLPGQKVSHKVWGYGVIKHCDGDGDTLMYHIQFPQGSKKLMAKYAALTPVS